MSNISLRSLPMRKPESDGFLATGDLRVSIGESHRPEVLVALWINTHGGEEPVAASLLAGSPLRQVERSSSISGWIQRAPMPNSSGCSLSVSR